MANIKTITHIFSSPPFIALSNFLQLIHLPLFWVVVVLMGWLYGYFDLINMPPIAIHQWRQADCLSQAGMYFHHGMNFFDPRTHNQFLADGRGVGEFPILYYLVAVFYHLFGESFWVFRSVWMLILGAGLLATYKMAYNFLGDRWYSAFVALLSFTFPVIIYYGNSFIADVPALSFCMIGWFFFSQFYSEKGNKWLWWSLAFFTLAGLLKITTALSLLTLAGLWFFEFVRLGRFGKTGKLFPEQWKQLLPFTLALLLIGGWYAFAGWYNDQHFNPYFYTGTRAYWDLDADFIKYVWEMNRDIWFNHYFYPTTFHVGAAMLLLLGVFMVKLKLFFRATLLLLLLGTFGFLLLQYGSFDHHDYYMVNLLWLVPWVFLCFLVLLHQKLPVVFRSGWTKIAFLVLLVANISHAEKWHNDRYDPNDIANTEWPHMKQLREKLPEFGVEKTDLVIAIPDGTPNAALARLNRIGWSGYETKDAERLKKHIENGAQYIIVHQEIGKEYSFFKPFLTDLIGEIGPSRVYRINPDKFP